MDDLCEGCDDSTSRGTQTVQDVNGWVLWLCDDCAKAECDPLGLEAL